MNKTIALEIPQAWLEGVPEEPLTLQQIFRVGLQQYKIDRALQLYRDGVGSIGYIAEQLKLPKAELIHEARTRGIEPEYSEQTLLEELG
jgi:hypothetical protein